MAHGARMDGAAPPRLLLRREALDAGWSDEELGRLARQDGWTRLRRGAYLEADEPPDALTRHRLLIDATLAGLRRSAVVSHQSAAVLWGFPLWGCRLDQVHVTRQPGATTSTGRSLRVHVARLPEDDVADLEGILLTSPLRTALDLARTATFEAAVVITDAALRRGLVDVDELRQRSAASPRIEGSRQAARVAALADGRSESVGESRSRVLLHRLGLAPSDLQHEVRTASGLFVARTDFVWEEERLVGEFDGRVKYGRLLRPGQDPGDAVFEEKLREDRIRDEDWRVVRWTWGELLRPGIVADRVRQGLARAARRGR